MESYQEWDMTIPSIPPRSRLYRLEPIGVGTLYVESLTSYIARLAAEHCVTPKALIMQEVLPLLGQAARPFGYYSRLNKFWRENALTLNGTSPIARQWVEVLQTLTSCENLRFLTMLTWSEVIATSRLLRRSKAWCVRCYEEWQHTHRIIYEPLLWALNDVDLCPDHQHPLVDLCPHCQKTLPFLTQVTRPGYCSNCRGWLGCTHVQQSTEFASCDAHLLKRQKRVAQVVGELLAVAPDLPGPPHRERIKAIMSASLDEYAGGNMSTFARSLDITVQSLWGYLRRGYIPYLNTLLNLCSSLLMTPLEFLTASINPHREIPGSVADQLSLISRGKRKRITADDVHRMRQALEMVLAEEKEPFLPLNSIARRLGCHVTTLRRHCPDLCQAIVARSKRRLNTDEALARMRQALEKALTGDERLPLERLAAQLGCDRATLRRHCPDLCDAIVARYRGRIDYERIRQRLQEVLLSEADSPSVNELAQQLGFPRRILVRHFPDFCKKIAVRRLAERKLRHTELIEGVCKEIRQAVLTLHQQGMYPAARQVAKLLSDPYLVRTKEGHEQWRAMLSSLGYSPIAPLAQAHLLK